MHFTAKMAPNHHFMLNGLPLEPVSRTYQYRKIMKPMLERKRRARINKCLDELKDLMTGTLQADGENVSKLEKADILELTVRHLHRLREHNVLFLRSNDTLNMEKFWAGFQHCAAEVSQFLSKYDHRTNHISGDLIKYIANYVPNMAAAMAAAAAATTNASIPTTTATTTASATNTPAVTPMNEHYQRFYTTLGHVPPPGMTATAATEDQRMQNSPTIDLRVLQVAKQPKVRMHPYARRMAEMGNDFSDGDGGGGDEVEAGDVDKCDGSVWRPW